MNWYIGQEVVCVKTHSQGIVKKGHFYIIEGLRQSNCRCPGIDINVGILSDGTFERCGVCDARSIPKSDGYYWFAERLFAPLMDISELESILKEETINK